MNTVYLDYAAATPLDSAVLDAMMPYFSDAFYNPSALYESARDVKAGLEDARALVARTIGCRPSEVVFTSGGTESANLAIRGVGEQYAGGQIVISAVEHEAVRMPAQLFGGLECPVNNKGVVDIQALKALLTDKTTLISIMYANNEVGSVQPLKEVVELATQVRAARKKSGIKTPLLVHADACQAPLYLDCNVSRLGVDMLTLNGGKIHGPKQSGILYIKAGTLLAPQIRGGGQEFGIRSGTENVAQSVGFAAALEAAQATRHENTRHAHELSRWFMAELEGSYGAVVHGHRKKRLPNNIHVTFPNTDNERVLFALDQSGIMAATGSACSASSSEPSHVLHAMGLDTQDIQASMRFTIGRGTTKDELSQVVNVLKEALAA